MYHDNRLCTFKVNKSTLKTLTWSVIRTSLERQTSQIHAETPVIVSYGLAKVRKVLRLYLSCIRMEDTDLKIRPISECTPDDIFKYQFSLCVV